MVNYYGINQILNEYLRASISPMHTRDVFIYDDFRCCNEWGSLHVKDTYTDLHGTRVPTCVWFENKGTQKELVTYIKTKAEFKKFLGLYLEISWKEWDDTGFCTSYEKITKCTTNTFQSTRDIIVMLFSSLLEKGSHIESLKLSRNFIKKSIAFNITTQDGRSNEVNVGCGFYEVFVDINNTPANIPPEGLKHLLESTIAVSGIDGRLDGCYAMILKKTLDIFRNIHKEDISLELNKKSQFITLECSTHQQTPRIVFLFFNLMLGMTKPPALIITRLFQKKMSNTHLISTLIFLVESWQHISIYGMHSIDWQQYSYARVMTGLMVDC